MIGLDCAPIGNGILVGSDGQVMIATAAGGTYSAYGDPLPAGAKPSAIVWPRYQFGSTSASNSGATPQYLLASDTLTAGNAALWKVTASGVTFTDITPLIGGEYGIAVSPDCITMPWRSGAIIVAILMFGSLPRLVVSTTSGASWVDGGVLDENSLYIRTRKNDLQNKQAFMAISGPGYSPAYRAATPSVVTKSYPSSSIVLGIEPYTG